MNFMLPGPSEVNFWFSIAMYVVIILLLFFGIWLSLTALNHNR